MGTNYESGRRKEWDVCKRLRAWGWHAQRSAGSHGLWDIVAVRKDMPVRLIQVKYSSSPYAINDANTETFLRLALDAQVPADYEMWVYRRGVAEPEIWVPSLDRREGATWQRMRSA